MCMFSRRVEHVSATKIFAAGLPDGRQSLIYSMSDAIEFVNLENYKDVFDDLKRAFPDLGTFAQAAPLSRGGPVAKSVLKVHAVGAFEASYVPRASDFDRLDPRFRLPPSVLETLPI